MKRFNYLTSSNEKKNGDILEKTKTAKSQGQQLGISQEVDHKV